MLFDHHYSLFEHRYSSFDHRYPYDPSHAFAAVHSSYPLIYLYNVYKPLLRQTPVAGCIRASGKDYRGNAASTESGQPCLHWRDPQIRVWNGLDQSAGFIIQSSPGGFGLDWIRNSPTQRILDWTGSINVQCVSHIWRLEAVSPHRNSSVWTSTLESSAIHIVVCVYMSISQGIWQIPNLLCPDWTGLDSDSGSSAGLDWIRISGSWIRIGLDRFNSIHSILCHRSRISPRS